MTPAEFTYFISLLVEGDHDRATEYTTANQFDLASILQHVIPFAGGMLREHAEAAHDPADLIGSDAFVGLHSADGQDRVPPLHLQVVVCAANRDPDTVRALLETVRTPEAAAELVGDLCRLTVELSHILMSREQEGGE